MNKNIFKKFLLILDYLEIQSLSDEQAIELVFKEITQVYPSVSLQRCTSWYKECLEYQIIRKREDGFDLSQPLTLFAKSKDTSILEALSLFECFVRIKNNRILLDQYIGKKFDYEDLSSHLKDSIFTSLLNETLILKELSNKKVRFNPDLMKQFNWILSAIYENNICTDCVLAYYIHDHFDDCKLEYRNVGKDIIPYKHLEDIVSTAIKTGVPIDRDITKELQSYFKDCLFHEFDHSCCICGISIPSMLIASHIKPFRDCGHLIEAADSSNGLLLCRNHDYLFDQGYVSFDDNGHIMICDELKDKEVPYGLDKNFQFKKIHLSHNRRCFLDYHRHTYYKGNKKL